jgi:hypothetical protein
MASRQARIAEFPSESDRPTGQLFDVLCEDHNGTYLLPYPCRWRNGVWWNDAVSEPVEAKVIGWRKSICQNGA